MSEDASGETTNEELLKIKNILKTKDNIIKELTTGKVTLAKELAEAQEKVHGDGVSSNEQCIKLTKNLRHKTNELKASKKEKNDLKANLAKLQLDMNVKNNKIADLEAQNVKVNDFNNKMYDICKSKGVFDVLEDANKKELDSQSKTYKESHESRHGNRPKHLKDKSNNAPNETENCWFYENGFCRQGVKCAFNHPSVMCLQFWSHGECDKGNQCIKRHPVQICTKYLNNSCIAGKNCVNQHPKNSKSSLPPKSKPTPTSPKPPQSPMVPPSSPMVVDETRSPLF